MLFSQRQGLTPATKAVQIDSMDDALRNAIWSVLYDHVFSRTRTPGTMAFAGTTAHTAIRGLREHLYKLPLDTIPDDRRAAVLQVRNDFYSRPWHGVYDMLETTAEIVSDYTATHLRTAANAALERENSAYRFVGEEIVPITDQAEMQSVDDAIAAASKYAGVRKHLETALSLLADRKSPDYRNSIKESISAVESLAMELIGDPNATLGKALNAIEKNGRIHPALKTSLSALYGWTSDDGGIRHAMLEESTLTFTDAKFMLVACTAFVNYMLGKVADSK